jgi:hypothetical protein
MVLDEYGGKKCVFFSLTSALHQVTCSEQGISEISALLTPPQVSTYFRNARLLGCYYTLIRGNGCVASIIYHVGESLD